MMALREVIQSYVIASSRLSFESVYGTTHDDLLFKPFCFVFVTLKAFYILRLRGCIEHTNLVLKCVFTISRANKDVQICCRLTTERVLIKRVCKKCGGGLLIGIAYGRMLLQQCFYKRNKIYGLWTNFHSHGTSANFIYTNLAASKFDIVILNGRCRKIIKYYR